jgi:hypothetical protein
MLYSKGDKPNLSTSSLGSHSNNDMPSSSDSHNLLAMTSVGQMNWDRLGPYGTTIIGFHRQK